MVYTSVQVQLRESIKLADRIIRIMLNIYYTLYKTNVHK